MALINCPECGAEISSKAPTCPKCGNPIASSATRKSAKVGIGRKIARTSAAIAVGLVALVIWAGYRVSSNNHPPSSSSNAPAQKPDDTQPQPPIELSATDLFAAYKANEVAADAKYKGQPLKVSGIVVSINKNVMGDPFIELVGENEFETVTANFDKSELQELSGLHKGQFVTVTCRGAGMILTSPMLDCK